MSTQLFLSRSFLAWLLFEALTGPILMSLSPISNAQNPKAFVASDFVVPEVLETKRFRLRMLTINDVDKDYEAVTSSTSHLQTIWRSEWPNGLTLEQNLVDLGWHQKEFQRRTSFAYTMVSHDESRVLGCVYLYPTLASGYDAEVYFWVRQSELASGLEEELGACVREWLASSWPFQNVAFPGRSIAWEDWL